MARIDNLPRKERKAPQLSLGQALGLALSLIERAKGKPIALWMMSGKPRTTAIDSAPYVRFCRQMPSLMVGVYDDGVSESDLERDLAEFYTTEGA